MLKTNYHTHTTFCDGHKSMEENVLAAIEKGFDILGFSSHSMLPFSSDWHIPARGVIDYLSEIQRLKIKYANKIAILCAFEADYLPPFTKPNISDYNDLLKNIFSSGNDANSPLNKAGPLDYLIGSVHYIVNDRGYFTADGRPHEITNGIKNFWDGDARAAICEYFATQRKMLAECNFTIWAHPDVIRRRNDTLKLFNENDTWYKNELLATAKVAQKAGVIAEVNTGGWARGNIQDIYPSKYFLSLLHNFNIPIIINTDAHEPKFLDFGIDEALNKIRLAGYKEVTYIDSNGKIRLDAI